MTEQAFNRSKASIEKMLGNEIIKQQDKLNLLKSYQVRLEGTNTEEELRLIHKEIHHLLML